MKYELKSRNITAAQKCAPDFHKSDTLAQTNQMKMTAFFFSFPWHRKHKRITKDTKIQGTFFKFYIVL